MKKKGELTTQQIVILIIAIVSFAVLLFLLLRLNFEEESAAQVCHNSVIMRSKVISEDVVPLNCDTSYICITSDGSCEKMTNPKIFEVKDKLDLFRVLAEDKRNCWWMFGEGKIDYAAGTVTKENHCSICSQIAFDNSIFESFGENLDKNEFYNYLANEKMLDSELTYGEYLFGTNTFVDLRNAVSEEYKKEITFGTIYFDKQYYHVMGITTDISLGWKIAAGATALVGFAIPGIGWTIGGVIVGGLVFGGSEVAGLFEPELVSIVVHGSGINNNFMSPTLIEANSEKFEALNCEEILTRA